MTLRRSGGGGGFPPGTPPSRTKVTIAGKTEICRWENLVAFFGHTLLDSNPPPPLLSSTSIWWSSWYVASPFQTSNRSFQICFR